MSTLTIENHILTPFDLAAKTEMERHLAQLSLDISDYTFAANYIWLNPASGFYAIMNDTFCLFVLSGQELSMLLPPLGQDAKVYQSIDACFAIMNANNTSAAYSRIDYVHEKLLEGFVHHLEDDAEIFHPLLDYIVERKLVDYVYKAEDLITLKGNAYSSKRNEINKFKKIHPNHRLEPLAIDRHGEEMIALFHKWVSDRMKFMPKEDVDNFMEGIFQERMAIKRLVRDYRAMDLIGLVIFIDDQLKGFTVGERINPTTASVIIEKTDFEILGCAQFLFREFSRVLKEQYQVEYINVGDDMGFENLRKVKMSYRPEKMIPKYTIYQKQS